ncbi:MAG: hypothetical protein KAV01_07655 [Candidatus Lokiarchaeota archaeon]|nr:hypothetical protein [Candidatus Lokiarchaeota archaeon]MCK4480387.1 hypothetical protein [Candidatus Lokiarchaeota archaeon]
MKKKNIGFILFGAAGGELLSIFAYLFMFPRLYEQTGVPTSVLRIVIISLLTVSIVVSIVLVCAGVIVLIKFRKED